MKIENISTMPAELRLAQLQVSFRSRLGHLALLLGTIGASVALGALLVTEPLPPRTVTAFAVLLVFNLCWMVYSAWVLTARRTMLFNHRVIAGRIAVASTTIFTVGATALSILTRTMASYIMAGSGLILLIVAVAILWRANHEFRALQLRRSELEAQLVQTEA